MRARSFYIEILSESIIDYLLDKLSLTRSNVLYTGGGHSYLLLPNTKDVKKCLDEFEKELNEWFVDNYKNSLFIASGYTDVAATEFRDLNCNDYKSIFTTVSETISLKKLSRYDAYELSEMNSISESKHLRECRICRRTDIL